MIRADLEAVAAMEMDCVGGWSEGEILAWMKPCNHIAYVVELPDPLTGELVVAGYLLYETRADSIRLRRLAIRQGFRRQGLGRLMLARLQRRAEMQRRKCLFAAVPEALLGPQCFLRALSFVGRLREGKIRFKWCIQS